MIANGDAAKWYCDECKKKLKEGRFANGSIR